MQLSEVATIEFRDVHSNDEALVIIRAGPGELAICLSSIPNGDVELFLGKREYERLVEALRAAGPLIEPN
jgi:hypothetical protein